MKVVAFNGSPRPKGNTSILLQTVLDELAKEGIGTELIQMGTENLHGCLGCYKCKEKQIKRCAVDNDNLNIYLEKMLEADGILLGSPTYFSDLTPPMKALIDRCGVVSRHHGNLLRQKVGAAVVAVRRAGGIHVFDSINHFFLIGEMIVPGSTYWNIGVAGPAGEVVNDQEGLATMTALGRNMAWLLKKIKA